MRKFKSHVYPPNGYVFRDRDGLVHTGRNWDELEQRVRAYREQNRMEPGDVHAEVAAQVAENFPWIVYEEC